MQKYGMIWLDCINNRFYQFYQATGRGREWSTQMYTPMNQAYQSEDVGGNRMSLAAKHVLESSKSVA